MAGWAPRRTVARAAAVLPKVSVRSVTRTARPARLPTSSANAVADSVTGIRCDSVHDPVEEREEEEEADEKEEEREGESVDEATGSEAPVVAELVDVDDDAVSVAAVADAAGVVVISRGAASAPASTLGHAATGIELATAVTVEAVEVGTVCCCC